MGEVCVRREAATADERISIAAHELRAPLVSILGFANLLGPRAAEDDDCAQALEAIHGEAVRALSIIDRLLRFGASPESLVPYPSRFDLRDVLEQQAKAFRVTCPARELRAEVDGTALPVEADRLWVSQVVANLLANAERYSPEGPPVTIAAERLDGRVSVTVSDRGPGFPAAQPSGLHGAGLGLAVCKELLAGCGGTIDVRSAPGEGTTVCFALPAA